MNTAALTNEFAKMRHTPVVPLALMMVLGVAGLSLYSVVSTPDIDPGAPAAWDVVLLGMSGGAQLVCPLLIAVLASRHVDMEHQGNGWLFSGTAGVTPGGVCRGKFLAGCPYPPSG